MLVLTDGDGHCADEDKVRGGDNGKDGGYRSGKVNRSVETEDSGETGPDGDENQTGDDGDKNGLLVFGDRGVLSHFLTSRRIGWFRCIEYISMALDSASLFSKLP